MYYTFFVAVVVGVVACVGGYVLFSGLYSVWDVHRRLRVPGVVDVLPVVSAGLALAGLGYPEYAVVWLYGAVAGLLDTFTGFKRRVQLASTLPILVYALLRFPPQTTDPLEYLSYALMAGLAFAAASTVNTYAGINFMESAHAYLLTIPLVLHAVYAGHDASTSLLILLLTTLPYALTTLPPARSIPSDSYRYAWAMTLLYASLALHVPHLLFIAGIPGLIDLSLKLTYKLPKVFLETREKKPRGILEWLSLRGYDTQEEALLLVMLFDFVSALTAYYVVDIVGAPIPIVLMTVFVVIGVGAVLYRMGLFGSKNYEWESIVWDEN